MNIALLFPKIEAYKLIILCFVFDIFLGLMFLSMPFSQKQHIGFINNFFNTISAITGSGLLTADINNLYTTFGKVVILFLIQIGAIGYVAVSSFFILFFGYRLSKSRKEVLNIEYPLPKGFRIWTFIKYSIAYVFIVEFVGAILLWCEFNNLGFDNAAWLGLFHSVSAVCTAGFSLFGDNGLEVFKSNIYVNMVISILSIMGAVGFIVPLDIYRKINNKNNKITFTTKIILVVTFLLISSGFILYLFADMGNINDVNHNSLTALFQVISAASTAGFNTVPIADLSRTVILILIFLMLIGASPSGTGGGIKTTSLSALLGIVISVIKGHPEKITFFNRDIPNYRLFTASAASILYIILTAITVIILSATDIDKSLLSLLFETVSALSNVGLSMGITSSLSDIAKILLGIIMFLGRVGIITIGAALLRSDKKNELNESNNNETTSAEMDVAL